MKSIVLLLCSIFLFRANLHLTWPSLRYEFDYGDIRVLNSEFCFFKNIACFNSFNLIPSSQFSVSTRLLLFGRCDMLLNKRRRFKRARIIVNSNARYFHVFLILLLSGDIEINPGQFATSLKFGHLNIASIRNKASSLHNYLIEFPLHILALNETWLRQNDTPSFLFS